MKKGIALITDLAKGTTAIPETALISGGQITHAIEKESHVELQFRRDEDTLARSVRVKVFINKFKPGYFRFSDFLVAGLSRDEATKKCGYLAALLAEQLINEFGAFYGLDPSHTCYQASKHFSELCDVMLKQTSQEAAV